MQKGRRSMPAPFEIETTYRFLAALLYRAHRALPHDYPEGTLRNKRYYKMPFKTIDLV